MNKTLFHSVRNAFISGLLVLAPLAVTAWVFGKIFDLIGGSVRPLFVAVLPVLTVRDINR